MACVTVLCFHAESPRDGHRSRGRRKGTLSKFFLKIYRGVPSGLVFKADKGKFDEYFLRMKASEREGRRQASRSDDSSNILKKESTIDRDF